MKPVIAQVITRMVPGGASTVIQDLLRGLQDQFHFQLITGPEDLPEDLESDLPESVDLTVLPNLVRDISPWRDVRAFGELVRFFYNHPIDLIHTHTSKAGLLGRFASSVVPRVPLIHTPHGLIYDAPETISGVPSTGPFKKVLLYLESLAAYRQNALTTLSHQEARRCVDLGLVRSENVHTIYNGVENQPIQGGDTSSFRDRFDLRPQDIVLVSVGRLSPEKGYDMLARVFARLRDEDPNLRLVIAGTGSERRTILEEVPETYREDLQLPGHVENVEEVLRAGDIFVLPSQYEGFGLSILEAMHEGCPVVATRVGGVPELVRDGTDGILVNPGSEDQLYDGLKRLISNPDLRDQLGKGAREHSKEFSRESMLNAFQSLYQQILGRDRS